MSFMEFSSKRLRARTEILRRLLTVAVLSLSFATTTLPARAGDESIPAQAGQSPVPREDLLDSLGVSRWHAAGVRGSGVKVAVLDSGFRGYRSFLGASLPATVTTRSFRADGNLEAKDSQHGILCGEVIHALAPAAELLLANWEPDSPEAFLEAVTWAKREGARVITCSVIMPSWSDGEGRGGIHEALARILATPGGNGDVIFCASAGNTARRHWSGTFHDHGDGYHEWEPGQTLNSWSRLGAERVSVELFWKPGPDYILSVIDRESGEPVAVARTRNNGKRASAVARFYPQAGHRYAVQVRRYRGTPARFHLVALSSGSELEFADYHGSVCFPADGPEVVAVGAVDGSGQRMPYSSCGPGTGELKPDFVARVPFPSQSRELPFGGTSAASPQAAALAALWLSRDPTLSAAQVRRQLRASANSLSRSGPSCETGFGLIHLP
jgi:subtilisin family serine protease